MMTASASETVSAADSCWPRSAPHESLLFNSYSSVAPIVWFLSCAVCIEFNKAGVGDEVTGLQAIRLIQSANIRSPVSLLADIS